MRHDWPTHQTPARRIEDLRFEHGIGVSEVPLAGMLPAHDEHCQAEM
jgi:hypothetical protein